MPGAVTTKQIRDGGGNVLDWRVWDESGAGTGPFSFVTVLGADAIKLTKADDAAFTPGTSEVLPIAYIADETATDSVDEGDAGAARMTLDRKQIVTPQPHSAGGCSTHRSIDLDEGTLEVVKNSPGSVYGMWVSNLATTTRFIKFYDATSGTAGTGTPVMTIPIPGNSTDDVTGAFNNGGLGIAFATGICVGATTGVADNDTGAPGGNEVIVNIFFK